MQQPVNTIIIITTSIIVNYLDQINMQSIDKLDDIAPPPMSSSTNIDETDEGTMFNVLHLFINSHVT